MPNRNVEGAYRYAFQGQEKDPETDMEAFELRLWDSRLGRWLTTDPYGQFSSPYLGMGNDPINGIDPNGGWWWSADLSYRFNQSLQDLVFYHGPGGFNESEVFLNEILIVADLSDIADAKQARIENYLYNSQTISRELEWELLTGKSPYVEINSRIQAIGYMAEWASLGASSTLKTGTATSSTKASTNVSNSNALGVEGEKIAGTFGLPKTRIPSYTGTAKYRVPDKLTKATLTEVKNVKYLSLTRQLKDFHIYSQHEKLKFMLHVRSTTKISKPLQRLIDNGHIYVKYLD